MKTIRSWLALVALAAVVILPAALKAGIPVFDAVSNFNRMIEHSMTMMRLALQIEHLQQYRRQFDDFDRYRRWIDGEFQTVRSRLAGEWTQTIQAGNLDAIRYGAAAPFAGTARARELEQAIQSVRRVMNGTDISAVGQVGPAVRALVGVSPESLVGARTKAAAREIEAQIAWVNRINTAVAEKRTNIEFLRARINSGRLRPGDLQRDITILAAEQADLQTLQIQAENAATRVALQNLSLQTAETNSRELERIEDSRQRLHLMQGVAGLFAPAARPN